MKTHIITLVAIITSLVIGVVIGYAVSPKSNPETAPLAMDHSAMDMGDDTMETMMMDMTARMEGKKGDELDRIFLEDMIVHHQGAVDMALMLVNRTRRPELKAFAQEIIDVQDKEIMMMEAWLAEWFPIDEN